jgi:hypothetical protein
MFGFGGFFRHEAGEPEFTGLGHRKESHHMLPVAPDVHRQRGAKIRLPTGRFEKAGAGGHQQHGDDSAAVRNAIHRRPPLFSPK